MSAVAAAIGGSAVLGLGGAYMQANAAKDAAGMQESAAQYAADQQRQMYEEQRSDQQPWRQAGAQALSQMQDPYFQQTFSGMGSLQDDPGYQFRMDQGQKALEASAAARGGLMSGNMGQALAQYGQDYASNEYQNAYNRFTNNQSQRFNRLSSIAGLGQTANGQLAQSGMNAANNIGQDAMGGANAGAAGMIGSANAWGGALSGIGNNAMNGVMMNKYMGGGGGGFGGGGMNTMGSYQNSQGFSNAASGTLDATPALQMPALGGP